MNKTHLIPLVAAILTFIITAVDSWLQSKNDSLNPVSDNYGQPAKITWKYPLIFFVTAWVMMYVIMYATGSYLE